MEQAVSAKPAAAQVNPAAVAVAASVVPAARALVALLALNKAHLVCAQPVAEMVNLAVARVSI